jgi:hypothetical protein
VTNDWPAFLLATNSSVYKVNSDGSFSTIHSGSGLYYGVSWDDEKIYLGCRDYKDSADGTRHSCVLTLNANYEVTGRLPFEFPDIHQILYTQNALYVTYPSKDLIVSVKDGIFKEHDWLCTGRDVHHLNSIFFDGNDFWICYHNLSNRVDYSKKSQVVCLDNKLFHVHEVHEIGKSIHNVFVDDKYIYVCNSNAGSLLRMSRVTNFIDEVTVGMWSRGIAVTDKYILVGSSKKGPRGDRVTGDARVHLLDRDTMRVVDSRTFKDSGALFGIRIIDQKDYAHNNIKFPGIM